MSHLSGSPRNTDAVLDTKAMIREEAVVEDAYRDAPIREGHGLHTWRSMKIGRAHV